MEKGRRYDARTRLLVGAQLRELYERGASIKDLTRATGRSHAYVRDLLLEAGATLRGHRVQRRESPAPPVAVPWLEKGKHYAADERQRIGAELRALYENGVSIRALVRVTGRSYGFVHRSLVEAGATLRGRGGPRFR